MGKMEAKYTRVYETLKRDILSGKYSSRDPFPSVAMIIRRFAISNLTAVKVLEKLKNDGLVKSYQGRGTFVTNNATSRKIGLIVPGVACTDFFQPIVSEINQLARKEDYTLLFAEVFSMDREERIHQVRELAAEFIKKRVAGVIYEPLAEPGGKEANEQINILGDDGVPMNYHVSFWKSEMIDFAFLQQDAFDAIDAISPMNRQKYMLNLILEICDRDFDFEDFEKCRDYFKNLINILRQMNYSEFEGENFNKYKSELTKLLS